MKTSWFKCCLARLSNPKDDRSKVNVSISLKFYKELQKHGAEGVLQREYGSMLVEPEDGFDATVQVDLANIPADWEEMVKKCGRLKRNCFAAVFEKYFEFQVCGVRFMLLSVLTRPSIGARRRGSVSSCHPLPR